MIHKTKLQIPNEGATQQTVGGSEQSAHHPIRRPNSPGRKIIGEGGVVGGRPIGPPTTHSNVLMGQIFADF